jgi:hypothetical protein
MLDEVLAFGRRVPARRIAHRAEPTLALGSSRARQNDGDTALITGARNPGFVVD